LIYYNTIIPLNYFIQWGSFYYAIYSLSIIILLGLFTIQNRVISGNTKEFQENSVEIPEITNEIIVKEWETGEYSKQVDLAKKLGVSAVKITRALKTK